MTHHRHRSPLTDRLALAGLARAGRVGGGGAPVPHDAWERLAAAFGERLRQPPLWQVPIVTVPAPPLLDPALDEVERARVVFTALRAAVETRFPREAWREYRRGADPRKHRHYAYAVESAEAMLDAGFAPAAWCAWSLDAWKETGPVGHREVPPPVKWALSPVRMATARAWFCEARPNYMGGRLVPNRYAAELAERWQAMRAALLAALARGERSRRALAAVADAVLPAAEADRLLVRAHAEAERLRMNMDHAVRMGAFLW